LGDASGSEERGHEVEGGDQGVTRRAGLCMAGPANDEGDTDPTLIEGVLRAVQWGVVSEVAGGAAVIGEVDDESVLRTRGALHSIEQAADVAVHQRKLGEVVGAPVGEVRGDRTVVPVHVLLHGGVEVRVSGSPWRSSSSSGNCQVKLWTAL